jgi:restriction system protein
MSRRRRTNDAEELVEMLSWVFSRVPPWVCIPVALIGLFLIPAWMTPQLKTPGVQPVMEMFGWFFGALWAMVWLAGGFGGWRLRRQRAAFLRQNIDIAWLNSLSWQEFERMVAEVYRQKGFQVEERGGGGSDGGIDLILTGNGQRTLVQCKRWRRFKVGVKPVRELNGVRDGEGAQRGILITSGIFTNEALRWAEGKPLELIDGAQCAGMLRQFQQAVGGGTTEMPRHARHDIATPSRPVCPVCGSAMVLKRAKRGANAGKEFWGCSQWPSTKCPGIINL